MRGLKCRPADRACAIEALARDEGLKRLVLETGELRAPGRLGPLYERAGFTRCGAVLDYPDSE